ncbi:MAG: alkaline phosphatase D [Bradymonadia bacterium]|jgi:alkaline phosphatase D
MARGNTPTRRDFLGFITVVVAAASVAPVIGCDDGDGLGTTGDMGPDMGPMGPGVDVVYPQGLASGDPRPDSVMLWTRVEPEDAAADLPDADLPVRYEVATDEMFANVVAGGDLMATVANDHTIRLKITGLSAFTQYYYRFEARNTVSVVGQTKTAPAPDADQPVRFAFASCQDYNGRYYHAWAALAAEPAVDFVVFLGDYIYETANDARFQDGEGERVIAIPDGLVINGETNAKAALTLADYRAIYKQYKTDADLREAHRLFAFITIWDDHEFADDCWGDHATHFNGAEADDGDEQNTDRRMAANQAWFEFTAADVTLTDQPFPNDLKIYRNLRFGQHMELVLTDLRSYRDDHVIPEGPTDTDVGKITPNSAVGSRNFLLKAGFDPKEALVNPTQLGEEQKGWLLDTITASDATWKVWGSEVQLSQMTIDLSPFESLPDDYRGAFYFSVDQWDGFRTERSQVLTALQNIEGLVSICGDIHAGYISALHVDFDNPGAVPIGMEFTVPGITSEPVQAITQRTIDGNAVLASLGLGELVPRFDELLSSASAHYQYLNSSQNGIAVVDLTADAFTIEFMLMTDVKAATWDGNVERVRYRYGLDKSLVRA